MPLPRSAPAVTAFAGMTVSERRVFISYSHENHAEAVQCFRAVKMACASFEAATPIFLDCRGDGRLVAGEDWRARIQQEIDEARVFVVLMSMAYFDSDFCRNLELRRIFERQAADPTLLVIPVALTGVPPARFFADAIGRHVSLDNGNCIPQGLIDSPVGGSKLGLKPISDYPIDRREDAWSHVSTAIEEAMRKQPVRPLASPQPLMSTPPVDVAAGISAAFLPYLCNRGDQVDALIRRLKDWHVDGARRPVVMLTEGRRDDDCMSKWVERLWQTEIGACLDFERRGLSFGKYKPLVLRADSTTLTETEALQRATRALADVLGPSRLSDAPEVLANHRDRERPFLLSVDISARDRSAVQGPMLLQGLLAVLAESPDLPLSSMLAIHINLLNPPDAEPGQRAEWSRAIEAACLAREGQGVAILPLGALALIEYGEVTQWAWDDRVREILAGDIDDLRADLPVRDDERWSMRTFATTAAGWLRPR